MTWAEACYIATELAVEGKHAHVTRYPVLGDGSCYPTKIHLCSTIPGRVVHLIDMTMPEHPVRMFPEYPILGNAYQDTVVVSFDRLVGLSADAKINPFFLG